MFTGKQLVSKRKQFDISQEYLARQLGVSRPTLNKIEKGNRELKAQEARKAQDFFDALSFESQEENMRINIPQNNKAKFQEVLLYILEQVGAKPNVGLTVLYKLLYFIDFDYYEKYEQQLMGLTYFKNTHGPTPRQFAAFIDEMKANKQIEEVRSTYFQKDQKKFLPRRRPDLSVLNGQELDMIDDVLERYSDKNATTLSDISHRDTPWAVTDEGKNIDYEFAFYRSDEFAQGDYEEL